MENENKKSFLEGKYLISANSEKGFYGFFEKVFSPLALNKLYIIHGGSGTGKSSTMKKIARTLSEKGARKQEIYCSSDTDSLDGVLLHMNGKTVGIVDGTAPHARIASLPGLRDEEWDFSRHLSKKGLCRWEREIISLQEKKRSAYQKAYFLLSPMGACHKEGIRLRQEAFDAKSAKAHAKRLLKGGIAASSFFSETRFLRAFSMKGEQVLKNWCPPSTRCIYLCGDELAAELYLENLTEEAAKIGEVVISIASPLCPSLRDGVYLPSLSIAVLKQSLGSTEDKRSGIYVSRFVCRNERTRGNELREIEARLKNEALGALAEAAQAHFSLEEIYSAQMDFEALLEETTEKLEEITQFLQA